MNTPICDFVRQLRGARPCPAAYAGAQGRPAARTGGAGYHRDPGADVLYHAEGVIRASEENAAALFGSAKTLYSAEGSSLCIRAMLQLAQQYARLRGLPPLIAAGRNAHRVFLEGAALLDLEIRWLGCGESLLSCRPSRRRSWRRCFCRRKAPPPSISPAPIIWATALDLAPYRRRLPPSRRAAAGGQRPRRLSEISLPLPAPAGSGGGSLLRFGPQDPAGADGRRLSASLPQLPGGSAAHGGAGPGPLCQHQPLLSDPPVAGRGKPAGWRVPRGLAPRRTGRKR